METNRVISSSSSNRLSCGCLNPVKSDTIKQLFKYYKKPDNYVFQIPPQKQYANWTEDNRLGFFLGVIQFGTKVEFGLIHIPLCSNSFAAHEITLMNSIYNHRIAPFKSHTGSCSGTSSDQLSEAQRDRTPPNESDEREKKKARMESDAPAAKEKFYTHSQFRSLVKKRDHMCVFCWKLQGLHAAHVIAQKGDLFYNQKTLLEEAGIEKKHLVQNGMLLCSSCHPQFDSLKLCVDFVGDQQVVRAVEPTNTDSLLLEESLEILKQTRNISSRLRPNLTNLPKYFEQGHNTFFPLYFDDEIKAPNRKAHEFHKSACLIWSMAGGAEEEERSLCSDDDDTTHDFVPAFQKHPLSIQRWVESSASIVVE